MIMKQGLLLLEVILTGSTVVADDVNEQLFGQSADAGLARRASIPPPAPATGVVSATTGGVVAPPATPTPRPAGGSELGCNDSFRQPIGPRGLDDSEKLRSLESRRIQFLSGRSNPRTGARSAVRQIPRAVDFRSCKPFSTVRLGCAVSSSSSRCRTGGRG
jgi:hypothetical protein